MIISTIKKIDKGYEVSIDEKTYLLDEIGRASCRERVYPLV